MFCFTPVARQSSQYSERALICIGALYCCHAVWIGQIFVWYRTYGSSYVWYRTALKSGIEQTKGGGGGKFFSNSLCGGLAMASGSWQDEFPSPKFSKNGMRVIRRPMPPAHRLLCPVKVRLVK